MTTSRDGTYKLEVSFRLLRTNVLLEPAPPASLIKLGASSVGQFAAVTIIVEPNEPGKGYEFESKVVGGAVPKDDIGARNDGVADREPLRREDIGLLAVTGGGATQGFCH